jgi:CIC family chloride channel protein
MAEVSPLRTLAVDRRQQALVGAAAVTGVLTGLAVAGFETLTGHVLLDRVLRAPLAAQAVAPVLGLLLAALALKLLAGGASPSTADQYVANFHDRPHWLDTKPLPGRIVASVATLGLGGAMGFEGPSIYLGAAVGSTLQHRLSHWFRRDEMKALLVAGAAGGVAAIFKAPATGVLFALEVPYQDDIARRGLIPALVAAAASYLTFVALIGTKPLLALVPAGGHFVLAELVAALVLGLVAGLGARGMAWILRHAKDASLAWPLWLRLVVAGGGMAVLVVVSHHLFGQSLALGPGYRTLGWVAEPKQALALILALFVIRLLATSFTVLGGGAGGLFIPLVVQGAVLGRLLAGALDGLGYHPPGHLEAASSLLPILGIAAFLGAGYRTPLAAVMFVAETTGKAVFVVPALVAAAMSQLVMARSSVSPAQQSSRLGHLERRFRLPLTAALSTDVLTVPPDATLSEFVWVHVVGNRQRNVAVVADGHYLGMCLLDDVSQVPREAWDHTLVAEVLRDDLPTGRPSWTLRDALVAMDEADIDRVAVTDATGAFVGEVRSAEIIGLDEILDDTEN